jgi:peptide deformylase
LTEFDTKGKATFMSLKLKMYGEAVLRERALEVTEFTGALAELVKEMIEVMYASHGIGLAAEQVGRTERVFVIDIPPDSDVDANGDRLHPEVQMPLVFINPVIEAHSVEMERGPEGCLSFPGMMGEIERWSEVDVTFCDETGAPHAFRAKGLLARAIQHELDHLNGVLFIDRMSPVKKALLEGRLKRLARDTKRNR